MEIHTEFGTRVLLLMTGGSITLTKNEADVITLKAIADGASLTMFITAPEAMSLIESLAAAARPGTGKPYVEVPGPDKLRDGVAGGWPTMVSPPQDVLVGSGGDLAKECTHRYPGIVDDKFVRTTDCAYGCGAWMGSYRSGAPDGIDPHGACPKASLTLEDEFGELLRRRSYEAVDAVLVRSLEPEEAVVCRKCSECDGGHHAVPTAEDETGVPCKHCDALGMWCQRCNDDDIGDGDAGCPACGGRGIVWGDAP